MNSRRSAKERPASFADGLEAVEPLSDEDREALVDIVRRRTSELGRQRVADEAKEALREFEEGLCRPATSGELMDEILACDAF